MKAHDQQGEKRVTKKISLGKALDRLEEIVNKLEREELELEDSLRLFDEGMELIRAAEHDLIESEGRLKQVLVDRSGKERLADVDLTEESEE